MRSLALLLCGGFASLGHNLGQYWKPPPPLHAQRLKAAYSFTPDLTLQSLVQYDSVSGAVSANTLLE